MRKFRDIFWLVFGGGIMFLGAAPGLAAASTPTVISSTANSAQVGMFTKYEVSFSISKTYPANSFLPYYYFDPSDTPAAFPNRTSPHGVDGITINGVFTAPSGKQITVPAFYFQDYTRTGGVSREVMTPSSSYSWKIRFAPEEAGNYSYYISIQDKEGLTRYPANSTLSFSSLAANSKGFLQISPVDSRFLAFSNGASFVPIGSGGQWWNGSGRSYFYEDMFAKWRQNGINYTRIWEQNDGFGLTMEGNYDAYAYPDDFNPVDNFARTNDPKYNPDNFPKGTQINQRGAYEKDKIIEAAEANGIYIQLCAKGDPYWIWDASIYDEHWNHSPRIMADVEHVNYWKRNMRYRFARWGYSTAIMSWEIWNESGHIVPGTSAFSFYEQMRQFQVANDPHKHLLTTSQNSQAYSPRFWSQLMDVVNYHWYLDGHIPALDNDETATITRFAWCLRDTERSTASPYCQGLGLGDGTTWMSGVKPKPIIWGETGIQFPGYCSDSENTVSCGEHGARFFHNIVFAGLFSPLGSVPLDWWWYKEDTTSTTAKNIARKAAANFFLGVDYAGGKFTFLTTPADTPNGYTGETISASVAKARVLGMRRADKKAAYLWVQNRDYTWKLGSTTPAAIAPSVTIGNLLAEQYKVEIWNTHATTGQIVETRNMTPVNGSLTVTLPAFTNDMALKIETTSAAGLKPGDANEDGSVNGSDYVIWLTNYRTNPANGYLSGDFNADGAVNGSDYVIWLANYRT